MDCKETQLEKRYVMVWTVNNLPLIRSLEGIMEGIGEIRNTNGEVVCGSNDKISQIVVAASTGKKDWSKSMPFT